MTHRYLAALALCAAPLTLSAQSTLNGRLAEQSSGRPMYCWRVDLLDSAGVARDSAMTRRDGTFTFALRDSTLFHLRTHHRNFADALTEPERIGANATLKREYNIALVEDTTKSETDPQSPVTVSPNSPGPMYPRAMRAGGIEGWVRYTYAVDTMGRIDTASAILLGASNLFFARSVETALPRFRFERWSPTSMATCARIVAPFRFQLQR